MPRHRSPGGGLLASVTRRRRRSGGRSSCIGTPAQVVERGACDPNTARARGRPGGSRRAPGTRTPCCHSIAPISAPTRDAKPLPRQSGSIAMKLWPVRGGPPSIVAKDDASKPNCAPMRAAARISTISACPAHLCPPAGIKRPRRAAAASFVGLPSASKAQPSGRFAPIFARSMISPRATTLEDWSITIGSAPATGEAKAIGLVPNSGVMPPHGAMDAGALTNPRATSPSRARRST